MAGLRARHLEPRLLGPQPAVSTSGLCASTRSSHGFQSRSSSSGDSDGVAGTVTVDVSTPTIICGARLATST